MERSKQVLNLVLKWISNLDKINEIPCQNQENQFLIQNYYSNLVKLNFMLLLVGIDLFSLRLDTLSSYLSS